HITCSKYADHQGVPAIFPIDYFSSLLDLQDDKGARNLIKSSNNVNSVLLPNAELDIDTVAQLKQQNS
ncbi:MAG: nucleotidyltransferase family protein, partial [Pseudoalteromonas sp.]